MFKMSGGVSNDVLLYSKDVEDSLARVAEIESPPLAREELATPAQRLRANEALLRARLAEFRNALDEQKKQLEGGRRLLAYTALAFVVLAIAFILSLVAPGGAWAELVLAISLAACALRAMFLRARLRRAALKWKFVENVVEKRIELQDENAELRASHS